MMVAISCQKANETVIVPTTGVKLDKTEVSIFPGEQVELKATVDPENSTSTYKTWTSSDPKIATVDVWGRVDGVSPGVATITVTTASGKKTASCKVTVKEIEATAIALNKKEATVYIDETETLTVTFTPNDASDKTVTWTSSNDAVATVDSDGKVLGVELGTAIITATSKYGPTATCNITVSVRTPTEPEQVELWKTDKAGYRGLLGAAADQGKTAGIGGWLSYSDGVAFWTENTTGEIRTATLELSTGSTITVTQLSAVDFAGKWNLYSKLFDNNKRFSAIGSKADCITAVTFAAAEGENGNNITISNLYPGTTVEGKVAIDYDAKTVKVGVYCSHKIYTSSVGYCVLLPECASATSYWAGYEFCPKNDKQFSDNNYDWLWFDYDLSTKIAKYQYHGAGQLSANEKFKYCGLSFVLASETAITGTAYDLIHQANYNGSNAESMYFKR